MTHETDLEKYIQQEDLNILYKQGTVKNIFGTEYTVSINDAEHYMDLSQVRYAPKEITLKTICGYHEDIYGSINPANYMAHMLAHELSHTETHLVGTTLAVGLLLAGAKKAVQDGSPKYFALAGFLAIGVKFITDELCAETAAYLIHGSSLETNIELYEKLLSLF